MISGAEFWGGRNAVVNSSGETTSCLSPLVSTSKDQLTRPAPNTQSHKQTTPHLTHPINEGDIAHSSLSAIEQGLTPPLLQGRGNGTASVGCDDNDMLRCALLHAI